MKTSNSPVPPVFVVNFNHQEAPDLIEVPPESPVKIKNMEEKHKTLPSNPNKCWQWIRSYVRKFRGSKEERPKRLPWQEYVWSFIGAFLSILTIAFIHFRALEP